MSESYFRIKKPPTYTPTVSESVCGLLFVKVFQSYYFSEQLYVNKTFILSMAAVKELRTKINIKNMYITQLPVCV